MSVSNMVADINKKRGDMKGLPMFDSANVVTWSKKDVVDAQETQSPWSKR